MSREPNAWEERGRANKVFALVDAIDSLVRRANVDPYADANAISDMLERWVDSTWRRLAITAGQRPPSVTTQQLVIARVRSRAELGEVAS